MAFTFSDLDSIKNAIMSLVSGAVQVQINGRMYRKSDLPELRSTYDWLEKKITTSAGSSVIRGTFAATSNQDEN
jgi:hypothetical protein